MHFKDAKYGNTQVELIIKANELEEMMKMELSMPSIEFITTTLDRIINKNSIPAQTSSTLPKLLATSHPRPKL